MLGCALALVLAVTVIVILTYLGVITPRPPHY
jgi:hypothetical protein